MLSRVGAWATRTLVSRPIHSNVYGLSRSLIAGATFVTLLSTPVTEFFFRRRGVPLCESICGLGLFSIGRDNLALARVIACVCLVVVASGWRPRITGVVHWWVSASVHWAVYPVDGGDQIAAVLTLLLLPLCLSDQRRWHWSEPLSPARTTGHAFGAVFLVLTQVQIAGIYLHAAISKMGVTEWIDGTALYYYLQLTGFAGAGYFQPLVKPALQVPAIVAPLTWSVLVLEFALGGALLLPLAIRRVLLWLGIAFHSLIALTFGLPSFSTVMIAALIILLHPAWKPIRAPRLMRSARARRTADNVSSVPAGADVGLHSMSASIRGHVHESR